MTTHTDPTRATTPDSPHETRFDLAEWAPKVYRAQIGFDAAARTGLDPALVELIQIRCSQLNGCAYCVHMHTTDARKAGESEERLHLVTVWREARNFFSEEEQTALALAEAVTKISEAGVPDALYRQGLEVFGPEGLSQVIAAICAINTWNRFAIATGKIPGTDERTRIRSGSKA
ncbi:carboxymuconolactone decarboxylase family protein [Streptomyces sp. NPDC089919]|uniref:carboxymuconolactone decarboxylase family protein n=1 Tax=Streptomyces sp. NPDC089919 TaxID=3155188 RepID=UPI00342B2024